MVLEGGWGWGEFINVASRAFESGLPGAPLLPHYFNKVWGSPRKSIYKRLHRLSCITKFSMREKHPCVIYTHSQKISCSQARGDEIRLTCFRNKRSWAHGGEPGSVWNNWGNQWDRFSSSALCFIIILYIAHVCDHQLCNHHWEHTTKNNQSTVPDTNVCICCFCFYW